MGRGLAVSPLSPKRYGKRYEGRFLSRKGPDLRILTTEEISDVCLCPRNRALIFRGGVRTQHHDGPSSRPTPATPRFANCSVPALQQVEHGSLHPSVLVLRVSPNNR